MSKQSCIYIITQSGGQRTNSAKIMYKVEFSGWILSPPEKSFLV
ncbi:MAG: hypothetical protein ACOH1X_07035 [Kaistella sp.]